MHEFKIEKKYIVLGKFQVGFFALFFIFGLVFLFAPENEVNFQAKIIISTLCLVVFGFFTVTGWLTLQRLTYADVAIDDDGIWYVFIGKTHGLVLWKHIASIKERAGMQRLELLDIDGDRLLRIEYLLKDFEKLRNILIEKTSTTGPELNRSSFSKNGIYHLHYIVSLLLTSVLGIYYGTNGNPVLGYGVMGVLVVLVIYEYAVSAIGITIKSDSFEISYPLGKRSIPFTDIIDIELADRFFRGSRLPEVRLTTNHSKKAIKLRQLGVGSIILISELRKALQHKC